jgi:hypothetical protein
MKGMAERLGGGGGGNIRRDRSELSQAFIFRRISASEALDPADCQTDLQVHYAFGIFYLILPKRVNVVSKLPRTDGLDTRQDVVALDPGVRKFLTAYSPQGTALKIGTNTNSVLDKCLRRIDRAKRIRTKVQIRLQTGQCSSSSPSSRWTRPQLKVKLRQANQRYFASEAKAKNVVKNLHYQSAHLLLRQFKTIILPPLLSEELHREKPRLIKPPSPADQTSIIDAGVWQVRAPVGANGHILPWRPDHARIGSVHQHDMRQVWASQSEVRKFGDVLLLSLYCYW